LGAVVFACLPLIALLFALIALAIVLDSPGPVLYRARRIGQGGKPFVMFKFRKMRAGAAGPALTTIDDARFTPIGRFLAMTRLDELPQLWNVVRGDMRLVGPRPEVEEFVRLYPDEYADIHRVVPGITGLAQLRFAGESRLLAHIADDVLADHYGSALLPEKIRLDRRYIESRSPLLDARILALTALLPIRVGLRWAWRTRSAATPARAFVALAVIGVFATFLVQVGI
jgi:lipopolysaccharide/colanic/teichoic acid biosynthesis glycosyltransferase